MTETDQRVALLNKLVEDTKKIQTPDMTVTIVMENNWPIAAYVDEEAAKKHARDANEANRVALEKNETQRKQFYFHQKLMVR